MFLNTLKKTGLDFGKFLNTLESSGISGKISDIMESYSGKFPDSIKYFWTLWKGFRNSGKFQKSLKSFRTLWNVSEHLKKYWTLWKVSRKTRVLDQHFSIKLCYMDVVLDVFVVVLIHVGG